jgi:hypothetical protein
MTPNRGARGLLSTMLLFVAGLLALGAIGLLLRHFYWCMQMRNVPFGAWPAALIANPFDPTKDARSTAAMALVGGLLVALAAALRR